MFKLVIIAIALLYTININCLPDDDEVVPQTRVFEGTIKKAIEDQLNKIPASATIDSYDFKVPSPWKGQGTIKKLKISGLNRWEVSDVDGWLGLLKVNFNAKIVFSSLQGIGNYTVKLDKGNGEGQIKMDISRLTINVKGTANLGGNIYMQAVITMGDAKTQITDAQNAEIAKKISDCLSKNFASYVNNHKSKISKVINDITDGLIKKKHSSFTKLAAQLVGDHKNKTQ